MNEADFGHSTSCPVAPLALEADRILRQRAYFDSRDNDLFDHLTMRLAQVEGSAAGLKARSREGLLFQALLAHDAAEFLNHDCEDKTGRECGARASACLASIALALQTAQTQALVGYYMGHTLRFDGIAA